jgi:TRAP-type C4-dicarboxylate transport system permease small subunit
LIKKIDERFEESVMVILLMAILVVMFSHVLMRVLFRAPLTWSEEACRYMFVWTAFMSVGYAFKKGCVLTVDALYAKFSAPVKKVMDVVALILTLGLFSLLAFRSLGVVSSIASSGQVSPALGIPMQFVYLAAPVGFTLGIFRYVQSLLKKRKLKQSTTSGM